MSVNSFLGGARVLGVQELKAEIYGKSSEPSKASRWPHTTLPLSLVGTTSGGRS